MRSDDYLDDELDERDRFSTRAIFASGWFRAALVLGVLAIMLAVAVPYVLRWMDPSPARIDRQIARPADSRPAVVPAPAAAPVPVPAPVAPAASASTPAPPAAVSAPTAAAPPPTTAPTPPQMASVPETDRVVPAPASPQRETWKAVSSGADARAAEPAPRKAAPAEAATSRVAAIRGGDFWVQVGAFQRDRNAEALVRSIRDEMKMPAQMSRRARPEAAAPTRHEVFVADAQVGAVNAALRGHGSAQAVRGGVAVQPPLELKDAVALSRRLSGEGMSVKIRRVGGEGTGESATAYVVRVGGYATRAQAESARRELARKGVGGFVAEGPAR